MTSKSDKENDDGHKVPCPWMQAMIWGFGIMLTSGALSLGHILGRMTSLENRLSEDHNIVIEMRTEIRYIKAAVDKLDINLEQHQRDAKSNGSVSIGVNQKP
jgi:hypothetical protein